MKSVQMHRFAAGGYVLHALTFASYSGKCSAWFESDGTLRDAEQILPAPSGEYSRPVKRKGPLWKLIAMTGLAYRNVGLPLA